MTPDPCVCYTWSKDTRFGPHMADHKMHGSQGTGRRPGSCKPRKTPLYAAVDMGTNNCRLLIAAPRRGGFTVVDSYSELALLGEGLAGS